MKLQDVSNLQDASGGILLHSICVRFTLWYNLFFRFIMLVLLTVQSSSSSTSQSFTDGGKLIFSLVQHPVVEVMNYHCISEAVFCIHYLCQLLPWVLDLKNRQNLKIWIVTTKWREGFSNMVVACRFSALCQTLWIKDMLIATYLYLML